MTASGWRSIGTLDSCLPSLARRPTANRFAASRDQQALFGIERQACGAVATDQWIAGQYLSLRRVDDDRLVAVLDIDEDPTSPSATAASSLPPTVNLPGESPRTGSITVTVPSLPS